MQYVLRVDYHETDLGPLLVGGLKPFVERARRADPGLALSYRTHWRHGPHVLIGLDPASGRHHAVAAELADHLVRWLAGHPSSTRLDPDHYARMAAQFATLEQLDGPLLPIHDNNHVELGEFARPLFWGDPHLSDIQDHFISDSLDALFDIIERRLHSRTNGLVALIRLLVAIDRMQAPAAFDYWPISLRAQAKSTQAHLPDLHAAHAAKSRAILHRLETIGGFAGAPVPGAASPTDEAPWIRRMEQLSMAIRNQVQAVGDAFLAHLAPKDLERTLDQYRITADQHRTILSSREYVAYRAFMNIMYMLFQLSGFTIQDRLLACRIISDHLDGHHPDVIARARSAVMELLGP